MFDFSQLFKEDLHSKERQCRKNIESSKKNIFKFFNDYMGLNTPDSKPTINFVTQEDFLYELLNNEFNDLNFEEIEALNSLNNKLNYQPSIADKNVLGGIGFLQKAIQYKMNNNSERIKLLKEKLFEKSKNENNGGFGYYQYYNKSAISININFLTCIFTCNEYNLDLSKFILSTYVHELSHYYTHLGKDKDESIWENFHDVDVEIKEGLAQYYTHEYFRDRGWLENFYEEFSIKNDVNKFIFPDIYRQFEEYSKYSREQVYSSMIYIRRNNIKDHKKFMNILYEQSVKLPK